MPKNQIGSHQRALRALERRRKDVMGRLLAKSPLLRGSLSHIRQRCGKPTCHCVRKPAHPVWRLSSSRKGRQRCQLVRRDDVEWVQEYVGRYKDLRRDLRALEAIHREEKVLLRGLTEIRGIEYE